MTLSYNPVTDEMLLKFTSVIGKPTKEFDRFRLWYDDEGNIHAFAITKYCEEVEEFRKNLNVIRLGGIWRGVKITDDDITEARETLLRKLEEKW
ncbi:MAG: hypothetical protein ONB44_17755 [candidate division KSB1 bacterium]|nr:hypothetical protein [candidate division KSB1 bacterium]MDZ7303972.1 hypothetical protein [candidate division KSB1 bacterium]MDZ7313682.1 hypothetical protein [candidate division KSB1 bacterium]